MADPTDDLCGPRPLRKGLSLADVDRVLREEYSPAIVQTLDEARRKVDSQGLRWWSDSTRMRRAWPRLVLFPRLEALKWRRIRLRDRIQAAWWAAREDWRESG